MEEAVPNILKDHSAFIFSVKQNKQKYTVQIKALQSIETSGTA
jgi:hypothetical protein